MHPKTTLVTGAAGFIGSHVAEALVRRGGHRVVGIDNFDDFYDRSIKEANVRAVVRSVAGGGGGAFDLEELDVTDSPRLSALVAKLKPQTVLHFAARAGVRPSIERPAEYVRVNVEGTAHLLEAAVRNGAQRFILASSSSVYGNGASVPFREDDPAVEPISPYAASKRGAELIGHAYWHLYRLPVFCLRFFTVYGPRQRPDLAIHKFAKLILSGQPIPVFGDGSTSRDYTYVDDVVAGVLAALERCDRFRVYNIGGSNPVSLATLIAHLERVTGRGAVINRRPAQAGDVGRTFADVSRARAELGYEPSTPIEQGLRRFVEWLQASDVR